MNVAATARPAARLRTYASFVRFEHTLFSLPMLLAGIFSVPGPAMPLARWLLVALAAVAARTAALALNRIIDRRIDALNPRTRVRELPSGAMRLAEAWALLLGSVAAYLLACAALGPWFLGVSPVPLAVFAVYPWLKRYTAFCHAGVGAALALAPLAGFAAAHPDLRGWQPAAWLAAFTFLWVTGFDIIYATLDEDFDRDHGVRSAVVSLGRAGALRVSGVLHAGALAALVAAWLALQARGLADPLLPPWPGHVAGALASGAVLAGVAVLLHLEQKWAEDVNLAFFKVNVWVGAGVLAMVLVARIPGGY